MKPSHYSPGAKTRHVLAALLLPWLSLTGQTLVNGNFDADTNFTVFPGYASGNGGAITGWTLNPATRVGLNTSTGPFANSGAIPSAPNALFIQAGATGAASISQTVTDLVIGTQYTVTARVSARAGNLPSVVFSTDVPGDDPVRVDVTPVGTNPYKTVAFQFTATATSHLITFTNDRTAGDHTLVMDDVTVAPSSTASRWTFSPWTGDADSGIDSQYVYTHAVSFGSNPPVTVNGVNFIGREGGTPGRFLLTDLNLVFGNRTPNNVTGDSANLAKDFRYNGANTGITLQNLKPDTQYVFTAYGLGFDAPTPVFYRSSTFGSSVPGSDKLTVNVNQYGQGNGIKVTYTYTTDAVGSPVAISYPALASGSWHTSGFSNREAVPSTPPVLWTAEEWTDDATSEVSPNHTYTHAFNFGSATTVNVNGINFTGLAGANPAGTNLTSANVPSVFNNDTNNVTGYGSGLARDFIYGGFPAVYNLSGLTPGKSYVFTLYSTGWTDGARPGAFIGAVGEQMTILDQDQFGPKNGIRFIYTYTADASGTARISVGGYDGAKSIHTYAMSNREADPLVDVAPVITLQPSGGTVGTGRPFVLRVGATGSATLSYQWKKGTEVVGSDSPVLDLGLVDFTDTGTYTVTVANGVNNVTSDPAVLTVLENIPGVFGTGVGGDGQPLPAGASDPHYTLLANPDNTESSVAFVQGNIPGPWLPNSTTSKWIGPRVDTVAATGNLVDDGEGFGNYVYRTQIDLTGFDLSTVQITGSWTTDNTTPAIRINGVATGLTNPNEGGFGALIPFVLNQVNVPGLIAGVNTVDFVVNNPAVGFTGLRVDISSAIGLIPPNTPPHIAVQPAGGNGPHNGTFTLSVAASGSAPLTYQWFKNNEELEGETDPNLVLDIVDTSPAGDYKVVVKNGVAPDATSDVAVVTVNNSIPVVVDDNLETDENTPLQIDVAFDMLANDTDADGDTLSLGTFAATSFNGGTITANEGVLTYTPASNFSGLDGFTYTVTDGWGGTSAPGTVLITVNPAPDTPPGPLALVVDLAGGTVNGTFTGTPGATYILQRSPSLEAQSWTDVDTEVAPESGIVTVQDPGPLPPDGKAFYRISYAD
jgi:hypothetical protein